MYIIETERLGLRNWIASDLPQFAEINMDKRVMEFFPSVLSYQETLAFLKRIEDSHAKNNFGLWATEIKQTKKFIGFVGLNIPQFNADFMPSVEIGWRLGFNHWKQGFATEAAAACLAYGFNQLHLSEIVSFTSIENKYSENVMKKIGMHYAGIFEHPSIEAGNRLRTHVLYRKKAMQ
jgi:[ribosomal protein S5]-alanine N-acetyltransferase